ncbi:hypothetical protein MTO96_006487 [Rhipicephalus appendiculatus]
MVNFRTPSPLAPSNLSHGWGSLASVEVPRTLEKEKEVAEEKAYQYGYEVGSAPTSMLDAGAKESSAIALGRYPVKDSAVGTQQV